MEEIPLSNSELTAMIDDEDFEWVSQYSWSLSDRGYVVRYQSSLKGKRSKVVRLSRSVMSAPRGKDVDHVNRDKMDNQKSNLRLATRRQNSMNASLRKDNTSGYKGVGKNKRGKWFARIRVNGKLKKLGTRDTPEEAALLYNNAAITYFGEFACLNPL